MHYKVIFGAAVMIELNDEDNRIIILSVEGAICDELDELEKCYPCDRDVIWRRSWVIGRNIAYYDIGLRPIVVKAHSES